MYDNQGFDGNETYHNQLMVIKCGLASNQWQGQLMHSWAFTMSGLETATTGRDGWLNMIKLVEN